MYGADIFAIVFECVKVSGVHFTLFNILQVCHSFNLAIRNDQLPVFEGQANITDDLEVGMLDLKWTPTDFQNLTDYMIYICSGIF